ncbi:AraC family transcriptional regulator [Marinilabiliaceae bacterium JC017]|nr:AraC family transcriptional regulator [Marinilabiliaceae bacterium JC017]
MVYFRIDWTSLFNLFGFIIALVLGFLFLFNKSENRQANVYLSCFMLSLSLEILGVVVEALVFEHVEQVNLIITSLFTIPFLFFYVTRTINKTVSNWAIMLFLPGIVANVIWFAGEDFTNNKWSQVIEYVFNGTVLLFLLNIVRAHERTLGQYYAELESKSMAWIKTIVYLFLAFIVFWILEDVISLNNEWISNVCVFLSSLLTLVMVIWIGHKGFSQSEIFKQQLFLQEEAWDEPDVSSIKPQQVDEEHDSDERLQEISERIKRERLFIRSDLNLRILAGLVQMKEKELSHLINHNCEMNFYTYINTFRLEEFKRLLHSGNYDHMTLVALAQEAGFKSKTSFYDFFRKTEGLTPSQYKKSLK